MIRYTLLESIRQIPDEDLKNTALEGMYSIFENANSALLPEIIYNSYDNAFIAMKEYFDKITNLDTYREELDSIAMPLYKLYANSDKAVQAVLSRFENDDDTIVLLTDTAKALSHTLTGNETAEEYETVLTPPKFKFFASLLGGAEAVADIFDKLITSQKFNDLYHRIKDTLLKKLMQKPLVEDGTSMTSAGMYSDGVGKAVACIDTNVDDGTEYVGDEIQNFDGKESPLVDELKLYDISHVTTPHDNNSDIVSKFHSTGVYQGIIDRVTELSNLEKITKAHLKNDSSSGVQILKV